MHWQALAADQPSGALPPGITLELGSPVNIAAGTSAPVNIQLTGGPGAGESGTILLKLFATESGSQPRAELRLDYRLHEARPGLTPSPTALELGVQQGKSISGKLTSVATVQAQPAPTCCPHARCWCSSGTPW